MREVETYRIRRVRDGTIRTYRAESSRGALRAIISDPKVRPRLEVGEIVSIRLVDGSDYWEDFKIYSR